MNDKEPKFGKKQLYLLFFVLAVVYNIWPVDIIADFIPVVGSIDDVLITLVPLVFGYKSIGGNSGCNS